VAAPIPDAEPVTTQILPIADLHKHAGEWSFTRARRRGKWSFTFGRVSASEMPDGK
jgi:hypothetical protein